MEGAIYYYYEAPITRNDWLVKQKRAFGAPPISSRWCMASAIAIVMPRNGPQWETETLSRPWKA